jgi:hypothetical protein
MESIELEDAVTGLDRTDSDESLDLDIDLEDPIELGDTIELSDSWDYSPDIGEAPSETAEEPPVAEAPKEDAGAILGQIMGQLNVELPPTAEPAADTTPQKPAGEDAGAILGQILGQLEKAPAVEPAADAVAVKAEGKAAKPKTPAHRESTRKTSRAKAAKTEAPPVEKTIDTNEIPPVIKTELKTVLSYMDQLLESLPEEKIEEFAQSEYFETYKKLFEDLGIA